MPQGSAQKKPSRLRRVSGPVHGRRAHVHGPERFRSPGLPEPQHGAQQHAVGGQGVGQAQSRPGQIVRPVPRAAAGHVPGHGRLHGDGAALVVPVENPFYGRSAVVQDHGQGRHHHGRVQGLVDQGPGQLRPRQELAQADAEGRPVVAMMRDHGQEMVRDGHVADAQSPYVAFGHGPHHPDAGFVQSALDGAYRHAQGQGNILVGEAQQVALDGGVPADPGQGREERSDHVAGLESGVVFEGVQVVGRDVFKGAEAVRHDPGRDFAQGPVAAADHDAAQPAGKGRGIAQARQVQPGREKGLLNGVLDAGRVAQSLRSQRHGHGRETAHEFREGAGITVQGLTHNVLTSFHIKRSRVRFGKAASS